MPPGLVQSSCCANFVLDRSVDSIMRASVTNATPAFTVEVFRCPGLGFAAFLEGQAANPGVDRGAENGNTHRVPSACGCSPHGHAPG